MAKATFVSNDGSVRTLDVPNGASLAECARLHDIPGILAECGCNLACGTCHVYVDEAWVAKLPPPSEAEAGMLEGVAAEVTPRSRLSCQVLMSEALDGIIVHVADEQ